MQSPLFALLGLAFATWRYLAGLAAFIAVAAVLLSLGGGWYGEGWGEFGIELNLLFAASVIGGATAGVIGGKARRRLG